MKKRLVFLQIPIKILILLLITLLSYNFLSGFFKNEEVVIDAKYGDSFHSLKENSLDVIVLGSSHSEYSFCPTAFFEKTGLYSYNLSSMCQPLEVSYQMLKEALKTQSPRLVILEGFTSMPLREMCEADSCYVTAAYMMTGEERKKVLDYLPEEKRDSYINEFMNNHNNWKDIKIDDLLNYTDGDGKSIDLSFGYTEQVLGDMPDNWWIPNYPKADASVSLDELDLISLNNILTLCKENNIELMIYKTPINSLDSNNRNYLDALFNWAKQNEVKFINFFEKAKDLDFYIPLHSDSYHCYVTGAINITNYIGEFVLDNYTFNHAEDASYDDLYVEYEDWYVRDYLLGESNPKQFLEVLKNIKKGSVLFEYRKNKNRLPKDIKSYYQELLNVNLDDYDTYYAIIKNGDVLVSGESEAIFKNMEISYNILDEVNDGFNNEKTQISLAYFCEDTMVPKRIGYNSKGIYWEIEQTVYLR